MESENTILMTSVGEKQPILICVWGGEAHSFSLRERQLFGRESARSHPDLSVPVRTVSRQHGEFLTTQTGCTYRDLGSSNGTLCNGRLLPAQEECRLKNGDVLRIHGRDDGEADMDVLMVYSTDYPENTVWKKLPLDGEIAEIKVGREESIAPEDLRVSRHHASFFHAEGGWAIIDHGSKNGVLVNNHRIRMPAFLSRMDVVSISGYLFIFTGTSLLYQESPGKIPAREISAPPVQKLRQEEAPPSSRSVQTGDGALSICIEERNVWHRMKKKTLLKDIRLEISSGSFVLILGGSGAGKTTFMNAVMGYEEAEGEIIYKDTDIYAEYRKMKYEIGYVPQQDLLRMNDTVYATLVNAAKMRLAKLPADEMADRVQRTLQTMGLLREKDALVGKLSGGQRKRLSIAVEYIGDPSLFFLDEPDSGLDGTMARALMENLRAIADEGKIVMVISHSPDRAFELFDQVIVLAKDSRDNCGRLAYYGSPSDACGFFEVDALEKIVRRINRPDEGGDGLADFYIGRYARENQ